jgi:alcohol dehydrogenase YqhD (iron-dependent ADH family)
LLLVIILIFYIKTMLNFVFQNPTKIIFGTNAMDYLKDEISSIGKKVMILYGGGSIKMNGIHKDVRNRLEGFEVEEFGGIEPNPRIETLRKAVDKARDFKPDVLLAVGGGSVLDGSKLVGLGTYFEGDIWDIVEKGERAARTIPVASILTLSATGSEMNPVGVITNWTEHKKLHFDDKRSYPVFSILNPGYTISVPKDQTAYGIIDTYSHVLEQYMNTCRNTPLQDKYAEGILSVLGEYGPIALDNLTNIEARSQLMCAATYALNGVIGSGVSHDWATHQIEHELSAFYDIPHAAGLAILTPRWLNVVAKEQKLHKLEQYAENIWNTDGVDEAIESIYDFFASLEVPMNLPEWDIDNTHFDEICKRLVPKQIGEIPLTEKQIRAILEQSLEPMYR